MLAVSLFQERNARAFSSQCGAEKWTVLIHFILKQAMTLAKKLLVNLLFFREKERKVDVSPILIIVTALKGQ